SSGTWAVGGRRTSCARCWCSAGSTCVSRARASPRQRSTQPCSRSPAGHNSPGGPSGARARTRCAPPNPPTPSAKTRAPARRLLLGPGGGLQLRDGVRESRDAPSGVVAMQDALGDGLVERASGDRERLGGGLRVLRPDRIAYLAHEVTEAA